MSQLVLNTYPIVSVTLTTLVSTVLFAYFLIKRKLSYAKDYVRVGRIEKLVIHPIKSCKGVEVDELTITKTGVKYGQFRDRAWVAIDEDGNMLNLVKAPNLITIKTHFEDDRFLVLENKFGEKIKIEVRHCYTNNDHIVHTNVFGSDIDGIDCGDEVSAFLSKSIGIEKARLIQHVDKLQTRPSGSFGKRTADVEARYRILYQNFSNLHLTTCNSLADLNERIDRNSGSNERVTSDNFRGNIVVGDSAPWDEDHWAHLRFVSASGVQSEAELYQLQNCQRCIQVTVARDTAEKLPEPMKTLKTFRKPTHPDDVKRLGERPLFGCIFATEYEGVVHRGDDIFAKRVKRI